MKNLFSPPLFIDLELVGLDGNAFNLMGAFQRQAIREGWSREDIQKVLNECISGDYDHLVATLNEHCAPNCSEEDYYENEEYWEPEYEG
jgi:hypothetical protein